MGVTIHHQFDLSISAESSDVRGLKFERKLMTSGRESEAALFYLVVQAVS